MMAPEPPADFVPRPVEFEALKRQLLDAKGDAVNGETVGMTAALHGAGGYGKTTLARALAHDPDIEDAYFDGVLWVDLGERGGERVIPVINDLVALLNPASPQATTLAAARTVLAEALGNLRILLVIDDVWSRSHLDPFLHGGRHTTRLVTTRFDHVLPTIATKVPVDAMKPAEAADLLAAGLVPADSEGARRALLLAQVRSTRLALLQLAQRLGEWPLLLTLANALLRAEVEGDASVADAIGYATRLYDEIGLNAFDSGDEEDRNSAARLSIGASLKRLDAAKGEVARFDELAVFPEDADIPAATITRFWQATGWPRSPSQRGSAANTHEMGAAPVIRPQRRHGAAA
jgi:NB-ARC domain